jgi:predicted phage replisome organizer
VSKYDKETKFYWLQLKEDFFEDDAIEWLEEQKPNGRDYAYFYLKLCLKALKSNGILIRKVGNILIPYDNNKLAELTKMDFDTVTVAMELLKQIGLVQILENGEIYITQLEDLIGSISKGAFRKQQQLERRKEKENLLGWTEGGKSSTKDKDKDKYIIKESNNNKLLLPKKKYFENEKVNELFVEFLDVRKKIKAVNSDRAINTLINKLNKYDDETKCKMIENSIVNSWKDVYELKQNENKKRNGINYDFIN